MSTTRLVEPGDVPGLAALRRLNRTFLTPWEPVRDERSFTVAGQQELVEGVLDQYERGIAEPRVILDQHRTVVGWITLTAIERGPLQSCRVGYWVDAAHNGQGLASAAVAELKQVAFGELGLHRMEAGTLVHNAASQRVLERNGFIRFGLAPAYLQIDGRWQDHILFQVLAPGGERSA